MDIKNNPTGRLLQMMSTGKAIPDNVKTRHAWAQIFNCEATDTAALLLNLAKLILLIGEAKEATAQHVQGDPTIWLAPFAPLESMLSKVSFDNSWSNVKQHITDRMISGLEFGSHLLERHYPESAYDEQELAGLLRGVDSLLEECLSSSLPEVLKKLFAHNLNGLRSSLIAFRISGMQGLQDEIDRIGGAVFRHREAVELAKDDPATGAFVDKYFTFIGRINDAVQAAQNTAALGQSIMLLLSQFPK
ncbi:TPA: hypothetical protein SMQ04_002208 [Pseudomonas putida]|nr:hypothetical protein [Pseudomonas putida]